MNTFKEFFDTKNLLWSKSPYKLGDELKIRDGYGSDGEKIKVKDIGYFERDQDFPFEFDCEFKNGKREWIKGHCLVP